MHSFLVFTVFLWMLFAPCLIALHASLAEEGPTLGYADTYRHMRELALYQRALLIDYMVEKFRV